jgi:hypothetical protein
MKLKEYMLTNEVQKEKGKGMDSEIYAFNIGDTDL